MLRGVVVREGECLVAIPRLEDERLAQTLAEDLGAREGLRLSLDGDVDGLDVGVVAVDRDEDGLRVETVFLLAEEIRRNEDWVCRLVGDDLRTGNTFRSLWKWRRARKGGATYENLGRSCGNIDRDLGTRVHRHRLRMCSSDVNDNARV